MKLLEVSENIKQKYLNQSQQTSASFILTALNLANQCDLIYKNSKNQRLQVELALLKMCHIPSVLQLAQLPAAQNGADDNGQQKKKSDLNPQSPVVATKPAQSTPTPSSFAAKTADTLATSAQPATIPPAQQSPVTGVQAGQQAPAMPVATPQSEQSTVTPAIPAIPAPPQEKKRVADSITLKPQQQSSNTLGTLIPSLNALQNVADGVDDKEPKYIDGNDKETFTFAQLKVFWERYANKVKEEGKINVYTLLTSNEPILENDVITVIIENKIQESILQDELVYFLNYLRPELKNFNLRIVTKKVERELKNRLYTSIEKYQYMVQKNPQLEEMRKLFNLDVNS